MFLIEPLSSDLEDYVWKTFSKQFFESAGKSIQIRKGRYIVNGHTFPSECIVLDSNDNVIDGFCGSPQPWLPWKGKIFIDHLLESRNLNAPDWYNEMFGSGWNEEFLDIQHWKL